MLMNDSGRELKSLYAVSYFCTIITKYSYTVVELRMTVI